MLDNNHAYTHVKVIEAQPIDDDIELTMVVKVRVKKLAQTPQLPAQLEAIVEPLCQQYKRALYQWLIEDTDAELMASREGGRIIPP